MTGMERVAILIDSQRRRIMSYYTRGLVERLKKTKGVGLYRSPNDALGRARQPSVEEIQDNPQEGRFEEETESSMSADDQMERRKKTKPRMVI